MLKGFNKVKERKYVEVKGIIKAVIDDNVKLPWI